MTIITTHSKLLTTHAFHINNEKKACLNKNPKCIEYLAICFMSWGETGDLLNWGATIRWTKRKTNAKSKLSIVKYFVIRYTSQETDTPDVAQSTNWTKTKTNVEKYPTNPWGGGPRRGGAEWGVRCQWWSLPWSTTLWGSACLAPCIPTSPRTPRQPATLALPRLRQ